MGYRRDVLKSKRGVANNDNKILSIRVEELQCEMNSSVSLMESLVRFEGILARKIERAREDIGVLRDWAVTFLILHIITAFLLGWFIGKVLGM